MTPRRILMGALVGLAAALVGWSVVLLSSVSLTMQSDELATQMKWIAISVAAGTVTAMLPFRFLLDRANFFYAAAAALLVLVLFKGNNIRGSTRWLVIGGFSLQPSEVMKPAFLLALARLLRFERDMDDWRSLVRPALLLIVPMALVLVQPNLSTATLLVPVTLAVLWAAGADRRHMAVIIVAGLAVVALGAVLFLAPYQKDRILSTVWRNRLAPAEQQREGYQLEQALRSVGIGGWTGEGWANGTQNRLDRLAFRHNDFIFSVAAEEFGFLGASVILGLVVLLVFCMLRVAYKTRDPAGRLFVVGAAVLFGTQSLVHVGVNLGLVPTTGMTLPFVSAGGSSLLAFSIVLGAVCSVARRPVAVFAGDAKTEQIERLRAV